jgi:N-acetylmuramic acid 6-phosphate etherase
MTHPPDRSHIETEAFNPRCRDLHQLSPTQCVERIIEEDRAVHLALQQASTSISNLMEAATDGFCKGGRLISFGAGTSGRLAVLDASEAPPTFHVSPNRVIGFIAGGDTSLRTSSEGAEDDAYGAIPELEKLDLKPEDTIIGVAAGGTTPYVRGGLTWAAQHTSAPVTAMICCARVELPTACQHMIFLNTGPEVLSGSTRMKAGTATKMALNTISTSLMIQEGRVYRNLMVDLKASNQKLQDRAARIFCEVTGLDRNAAFAHLDLAKGQLKTALVMHQLGVDFKTAQEALNSTSLSSILDNDTRKN